MRGLYILLSTIISVSLSFQVRAQSKHTSEVFISRAEKITKPISISTDKKVKVTNLIANRYQELQDIQKWREDQAALLGTTLQDKEQLKVKKQAVLLDYEEKVLKGHKRFVKKLSRTLSEEDIELVKNGLTYNVAPNTMQAYKDMIPELTQVQSEKILNWLLEARELAMDGESSEKKHAMFGKYKGRINNYLSAEGYDLKKAGEEWQKRINAKKSAK